MTGRRRAALAAAAAVALLSSCTPATPAALPDGVTVELVQLRSDLSVGRMQLHVRNASAGPVELLSARLAVPAFREEAVWKRAPATVAPGAALNLPVTIPEVSCDAAAGEPVLTGEVRWDGEALPFRVRPEDPLGAVGSIVAAACAAESTEAAVAIEATGVAVEGTGPASVAVLTVGLRPTGSGRVRLVEVRPTVLLRAEEGDGGWPLDVAVQEETPPSALTLPMEPARCDAHALADDKVGTRFPVVVELEDGTIGRFPLPLAAGVKDALLRFVAARCGLSG
ncbi:hypothetical protein [Naasia sp. SYSU D00948]|uniref:hypothetical protein n=1 Tax=Naasia sp. SYSU D00948 TaxID=2817379 RepID=UPI001B3132CF|nr:hypothetical protein [Naasia sp. SYSU D00948]